MQSNKPVVATASGANGPIVGMLTVLICCLALRGASARTAAPEPHIPHIVILATGGTIAGTASARSAVVGYKSGVLTIDELINRVPEITKVARIDGEQISNVSSEDMTTDVLLRLAKRINVLLRSDGVDGVVVTHGTDTLEESSYFLNLVIKSRKPVVVTAAMRPATSISADGPMNIYQAVILAAAPNAAGRGVLVMLNDRIGSARFMTKTNTTSLDTFKASEEGYLGVMVGGRPYFETRVDKQHTDETIFDISLVDKLPDVEIIYGYQDDPAYLYDAAVAHGAKGIVIAGVGAGEVSKRVRVAILRAERAGVVIVRSSRTGSGLVYADSDEPGLVADSLNPAKARVLLRLALNQTHDLAQIQDFFHRD